MGRIWRTGQERDGVNSPGTTFRTQLASPSQRVTLCEFSPTAKRLESYQEAVFEEDECTDTLSGSLSNMAKPRAHGCRTVPRGPLGSKSSTHLSGSTPALGSGEGSGEVPHSRQAAFSSPIVSVKTSSHSEQKSPCLVLMAQTTLLFFV